MTGLDDHRYPLVRDVRYRVVVEGGRETTGTGTTLEISRRLICFTAEEPLPVGALVEVSVSWPVRLDRKISLRLVARGYVFQSEGTTTSVSIQKYEFRTQGSASLAREAGA